MLGDGTPMHSIQELIERSAYVDGAFGAQHDRRFDRLAVEHDDHCAGRRAVQASAAVPAGALDAHWPVNPRLTKRPNASRTA